MLGSRATEKERDVSDRKLSDSTRSQIKKSQSLCRHTRAQITCGIFYKRFNLKFVVFDIKQKKMGQFSIWRGSMHDSSLFFDKVGGQALSL